MCPSEGASEGQPSAGLVARLRRIGDKSKEVTEVEEEVERAQAQASRKQVAVAMAQA